MAGQSTELERAVRRRKVTRMHLQGYSQREIADELGWHESTISRDIDRINEEMRDRFSADMYHHKMEVLAENEQARQELWQNFYDPPEQEKTTRRVTGSASRRGVVDEKGELASEPRPEPDEIMQRNESTMTKRDPRLILRIKQLLDQKIELLGLDQMQGPPSTGISDKLTTVIEKIREEEDLDRFEDETWSDEGGTTLPDEDDPDVPPITPANGEGSTDPSDNW